MAQAAARKTGPSWKKGTWHTVTGASGTEYQLRIPSITVLIRNEAVPEHLRAIALRSAAHPNGLRGVLADDLKASKEQSDEEVLEDDSALKKAIDDVAEMQKHLITESVKCDGKFLTVADLEDEDFPQLDAEMLAGMCVREVVMDAKGVRVGIEPLDAWERFRHFHDCGPSCSSCAALQDDFSSVDLGGL